MNKFFYGKLAFSNLKKNSGLYLPYILTAIGVGAMYYIMGAITRDEGIQKMPGSDDLQMVLNLGCGVISVFAVIFLFYTNSFLMKRRKKEFGLFNILGMEKRHIGKMMFWEMLMVAGVSIICGIAAGVLLNKLVVLALMRLVDFEVPFGFTVSVDSMISMAILFVCIFAATLVYNLFQVRKAKPIELLQSTSQGEKEPKTRWVLAVIGILTLGAGYGIAIFVKDPISTLLLFFVAVLLVMAGTYCLFTAGSIALLKLMRRNKSYYYKTSHFISVSGMIYRMKQNAVGLSNICILSTMVLVMISGTVSLYMGVDDAMNSRYPKEISVSVYDLPLSDKELVKGFVEQAAEEQRIAIAEISEYRSLAFAVDKKGEKLNIKNAAENRMAEGKMSFVEWITMEDYESLGGKHEDLSEDEILVYTSSGEKEEPVYQLGDQTFRVKEHLSELNLDDMEGEILYDVYFLVVKDEAVLQEIYEIQKSVYQEQASSIVYSVYAEITGTEEQKIACAERIQGLAEEYNQTVKESDRISVQSESKTENRNSFMHFCGGFLFLGIFLGFIFLMATALIIYYKQISEGYEDKVRFEIMQKVGMSKKEVRASIRSQILKVFFLPLVMACIHLAAAFPMINRLIMLFGMMNAPLFAVCTVVTVGVFAVVYAVVYVMTAKAYYKIVG